MRLFISLFLVILAGNSFATAYYVSNAGNNANAGNSTITAWKTIQYALNHVTAGDIINVMAGTYPEKLTFSQSGTAGNYITLQNYLDETVILDGSAIGNNQDQLLIQNKNFIVIDGLNFTGHNGKYQPVIHLLGNCSNIIISNNSFYNTDCNESYVILAEGRGDAIEITGNIMTDILGSNAVGILFVGSNTGIPFSNILIQNNHLNNIEPAPSEAIAVNGNVDGFEIIGNTLTNINNIGIAMIGGEDWVNTNDAVNQARNGVCKNNSVSNANSIYGGGFAAGIYVDGGKDIIVENNIVTGSDIGLEIGCENAGFIASGNIVRNNIIYKNEKSGLGFGGYDFPSTGQVQNCIFTGNTVYDNDLLNTGFGQLWIQYALNCQVYNNIFYAVTNPWMVNAETVNTSMGNLLDHNDYYYTAANPKYYFDFDLITGHTAFISATGQDENSLFMDALFVDPLSLNFHLQVSSPCRDAGNDLYINSPSELDMDGDARVIGGISDIGADELTLLPLNLISNATPAICYGSCTASLLLEGSGGCAPYTIQFKLPGGGAFMSYTELLENICAGNYKVKITDDCGTTITQTIAVGQNPLLNLNVTNITHESVEGASDGKITVKATGGVGIKQYSINNGATWQTTKKFTGLGAGDYTIICRDAVNCTDTAFAEVEVVGRSGTAENFPLLYPNPGNDFIFITQQDLAYDEVLIKNMEGKTVLSVSYADVGNGIPVHFLASGVYTVVIKNGNTFFSILWVKE